VEFYPVVNHLVTLAKVDTVFHSVPVPGSPAGTFLITAAFNNTSNQTLLNPFIEVVQITGGNFLLNPVKGAGQVGARLAMTDAPHTALEPGGTSVVEFSIGLQMLERFVFIINLLGETGPQLRL
jgi:hypothetical protein